MAKLSYNPIAMLWHVLRNDLHKLENDPRTQYHYHRAMTRYWALNIPIICLLFFFAPKVWIAIALFINTLYSLYANLATDFGDAHSAYAAWKAQEIQRTQNRQSKVLSVATFGLEEA